MAYKGPSTLRQIFRSLGGASFYRKFGFDRVPSGDCGCISVRPGWEEREGAQICRLTSQSGFGGRDSASGLWCWASDGVQIGLCCLRWRDVFRVRANAVAETIGSLTRTDLYTRINCFSITCNVFESRVLANNHPKATPPVLAAMSAYSKLRDAVSP